MGVGVGDKVGVAIELGTGVRVEFEEGDVVDPTLLQAVSKVQTSHKRSKIFFIDKLSKFSDPKAFRVSSQTSTNSIVVSCDSLR